MHRKLLVLSVLAACGGDDQPNSQPDSHTDQPLVCKSIALCTTYEVKTFTGTVPAATGGTVASGVYRLAYKLIPDDVGETGGYHDELEALEISGTQYNWAGFFRDEIGNIATSGTTLTFRASRKCSRGSDGDPSTNSQDYKYTATSNQLLIYDHVTRSDGVQWDEINAYVLTTSPQDVCTVVNSEPSAPGDSARCTVTNCACNFAVNDTVSECT
jgi:hypothetical protein